MQAPEAGETGVTPIQDAACVVVVDDSGAEPRLLLGRRHTDQVFLPDKWVFPGGRVDPGDRSYAAVLDARLQGAPRTALLPFKFAAIRELYEETGLVIGEAGDIPEAAQDLWRAFAATGYSPAIASLAPLARAITPPGRPRRYDTWFFLTTRRSVAMERPETDGELLDPGWFTLAKTRRLDLPNITRLILDDVGLRIGGAATAAASGIPFYFQDGNGFQRTLI